METHRKTAFENAKSYPTSVDTADSVLLTPRPLMRSVSDEAPRPRPQHRLTYGQTFVLPCKKARCTSVSISMNYSPGEQARVRLREHGEQLGITR